MGVFTPNPYKSSSGTKSVRTHGVKPSSHPTVTRRGGRGDQIQLFTAIVGVVQKLHHFSVFQKKNYVFEAERQSSHPLVDSPDAHNGWG